GSGRVAAGIFGTGDRAGGEHHWQQGQRCRHRPPGGRNEERVGEGARAGGEHRVTPLLLVLSSPSGGGKSTMARRVLAERDDIAYSVSATTRPPRPGEVDG